MLVYYSHFLSSTLTSLFLTIIMKSLSLLVLVAGSVTVLARALPSDYSLDARNALPDADGMLNGQAV